MIFALLVSAFVQAAPVATVELLEAGAGTELNYWTERIRAEGFQVSVQGSAQNARSITQIFYAPGFEPQARRLGAALQLPAEALQLRTWKSPWDLTIAAAPVPRTPEDEAARAQLKALDRPVTDDWLLEALKRGIHSVEHREKLRKELRGRRELSPALVRAILERFPDLLIEKSPTTVLPLIGERLAFVKPAEVAGLLVAREPAQLNEAQQRIGDDRKLQVVMLTTAVHGLMTNRDESGAAARKAVLLAWLPTIENAADVRSVREELRCKDLECLDASGGATPSSTGRSIWSLDPASLSSDASAGLAMLLARGDDLLDWGRAVPEAPTVNWAPWLLDQVRARRLALAPLITVLEAWKVDLFALRAAPPEPLTALTDSLLVESGCARLKKSTDEVQRAKTVSRLLTRPEARVWSAIGHCAYEDAQHSDLWVTALTANVEHFSTELFVDVLDNWESVISRTSPPVRAALFAALERAATQSPQAPERKLRLAVFQYARAGHPRDRLIALMKELPTSPPLRRLLLNRISVALRQRIGAFGALDEEKKAAVVADLSAALEVARAGLKASDTEVAAELAQLEAEVKRHVPFIYSM